MNKKYGLLVALLIFLSTGVSFAAERPTPDPTYEEIIAEYKRGSLGVYIGINPQKKDIIKKIIEENQAEAKKRQEVLESSYIPKLLKAIASVLVISSAYIFGMGIINAMKTYSIFKKEGISYPEQLKNFYTVYLPTQFQWIGVPQTWFSWFTGEKSVGPVEPDWAKIGLSEREKEIVGEGILAPPYIGMSLIVAAISRSLFNKAASYKEEAAQLADDIKRDKAILEELKKG